MIAQPGYLGSLSDAGGDLPSHEVGMLVGTADRFLREGNSVQRFRAARGRGAREEDRASWAALCSLGLVGACAPARAGGSDLAPSFGVFLTEVFGRHLAPEPFVAVGLLPSIVLGPLGSERASQLLAAGAVGRALPVLAVQESPGQHALDRLDTRLLKAGRRFELSGRKRFVLAGAWATHFVVSARADEDLYRVVVERDAPKLHIREHVMMDGTISTELLFENTEIDSSDIVADGKACVDAIVRTFNWAHIAVSAELFGLSTALLGMTIEYLCTRTQFDRPIGSFQALQHRSADLYCQKEIARFTIAQALADMLEDDSTASAAIASRCKARAAETAIQIAREAVQLHGAIGFSDEADVGLYMKRVLVLAAWLGGADYHRRRYAELNPYRID